MKKLFPILIILIMLVLSACGGGAVRGSVSGQRLRCSSDTHGGNCEGSFKKLKGTISEDMSLSRKGFDAIYAEVEASVENGTLRVFLKDPEGVESSVIIHDGEPGFLAGFAEGFHDSFRVYFEAVEGEAEDIQYTVVYTYP